MPPFAPSAYKRRIKASNKTIIDSAGDKFFLNTLKELKNTIFQSSHSFCQIVFLVGPLSTRPEIMEKITFRQITC
jgi:hypothetical protein